MLILFDHGTPIGLARELSEHIVTTARTMGWEELGNGDLLRSAEQAGFELLLTTDQRIRYQQNLSGRRIAILVLSGSTKWSRVKLSAEDIRVAISASTPGSYAEVYIAFRDSASGAVH